MIIEPPKDDVQYDEESPPLTEEQWNYLEDRIQRFLTAIPWMCPSCNLKNHGWNKACANFRCRKEKPNG